MSIRGFLKFNFAFITVLTIFSTVSMAATSTTKTSANYISTKKNKNKLGSNEEWKPKYLERLKTSPVSGLSKNSMKSSKQNILPVSDSSLLELYKMKYRKNKDFQELKDKTLALKQKAVPSLVKVIKSSDYPDKNRWIAMFMLGRIMGKKSSKFISKFAFHRNWMLRLSSLKVLLALKATEYKGLYSKLLKDKSLIVRHQALENIRALGLKELAPFVWAMLYDKSNYVGSKGERKRGHILKLAIKSVGELDLQKSKKPMLKMISNKKYSDLHNELDYSLEKLFKTSSPKGSLKVKTHFWKRKLSSATIIQ